MSLITAVDLAKSYGPDDIFSGISFTIPQGARLAIVGPNGIGKTTLCVSWRELKRSLPGR
jgi:ATP-binding cassette, subfamily F, member 3